MGMIFSSDILDLGTISARSQNASYPASNVGDLWHLKRRFRAGDAITGDWLLKFDLGATISVAGIFLNDVNFDKVQIQAHGSDAWSTPDYDSGEIPISQNPFTGRYQVYIPVSFSKQWVRIYIPSSATVVGDYTSAWEIGTVVLLGSVNELSKGAQELSRGASDQVQTIKLPSGAHEAVQVGDALRWEGEFAWAPRRIEKESDLLTLNRALRGDPLVYYDNQGDTWDAYLCRRDTSYSASEAGLHVESQAMKLVEII